MNKDLWSQRFRIVADRLTQYDPADFTCCGMPLEESGRCAHRDHHGTPFNPYALIPLSGPDAKVPCDCLETGRIWCCMPDRHFQPGETS